jgi:hypothetical protein
MSKPTCRPFPADQQYLLIAYSTGTSPAVELDPRKRPEAPKRLQRSTLLRAVKSQRVALPLRQQNHRNTASRTGDGGQLLFGQVPDSHWVRSL